MYKKEHKGAGPTSARRQFVITLLNTKIVQAFLILFITGSFFHVFFFVHLL